MERALKFQVDVNAPIKEVWQAWTTDAGARTFFAPECKVDAQPGGAYEMYWEFDKPVGQRGSEGMVFLGLQEPHMLSFTWNAPTEMPEVRDHRTHVAVRLEELQDGKTRVHFREDGWGEGEKWNERMDYFRIAWGKVVLPLLAYRFAEGPVNWQQTPDTAKYQKLVKEN
jgi:uncharacterized protein YndB with AHSA1/START domain